MLREVAHCTGRQNYIIVDEQRQIAQSLREPCIPCCRQIGRRQAQVAESARMGAQKSGNLLAVGLGLVDDGQLHVAKVVLRQDRGDRRTNRLIPVIGANNYGNCGVTHLRSSGCHVPGGSGPLGRKRT